MKKGIEIMKKTLAIILSVLMVVCMMPGMAFAAGTPLDGATITFYESTDTGMKTSKTEFGYTGEAINPKVKVVLSDNTVLTEKVDYTVVFSRPDGKSLADAGTITAVVTGKGEYEGTIQETYEIKPIIITDAGSITILDSKAGATTLAGVKYGEITLIAGKDYTITALDPATIAAGGNNKATIRFEGNYSGTVEKEFNAKYNLADYYNVTVNRNSGTPASYTYNGTPQGSSTDYTVSLTTKKDLPAGVSAEGKDYEAKLTNNINAGTPTVTVTAKGDIWTGSVSASAGFTITPKSLNASDIKVTVGSDGLPLVKDVDKELKSGTDYTVALSGSNYVITGKGNYTGSRSINGSATNLNDCTVTFAGFDRNGYPTFTVKYGSTTLRETYDYRLSYTPSYSTYASSYTVTLSPGINNTYYGSKYQTIATSATNNMANCSITVSPTTSNYTGYQIKPTVTVYNGYSIVSSAYYDVSYYNNINPGTATVTVTGKGLYYGTKSTYFTITNYYNLANCTATLSQTTYAADGYAKRPTVTVKDGYTTLSPYSDYTVDYKDNVLPGIASVVLTGKGKYTGTSKIVTFTITGLTQTMTVDKDKYIKYLTSDSFKVNPKATGDGTGFSYSSSNNSVVSVNSYTGEISIVGTGRAEIKISTIGNKKYTPVTKIVTVDVKPKKPSFKVSSSSYGKLTTRITKVAGATKYQIRYGRMGSYKSVYVSQDAGGDSTVSRTVKANHGKAYFVKVRSYKTMSDGTKVWGNWTVTKKVYVK